MSPYCSNSFSTCGQQQHTQAPHMGVYQAHGAEGSTDGCKGKATRRPAAAWVDENPLLVCCKAASTQLGLSTTHLWGALIL